MPYEFEDLSKQVSQGASDVKNSLDNLVGAAGRADQALGKLTETQKTALQISEKFEKALNSSVSSLKIIGHSGITASRGLKTVDQISKSAAVSLNMFGAGASSAAVNLKALSAEAVSFSTNIGSSEKSIAGLAKKLQDISKKEMPSLVQAPSASIASKTVAEAVNTAKKVVRTTKNSTKSALNSNPTGMDDFLFGDPASMANHSKQRWNKFGRMSMGAASVIVKQMKLKTDKDKDNLELMEEGAKTPQQKRQYVELAVKISGDKELRDFIDDMKEADQKIFRKEYNKNAEKAIDSLKQKFPILGLHMKKAAVKAEEAAKEMMSDFKKLEDTVNSEAKTIGDSFKKMFAEGQIEGSKFFGGLGKNATGMLAAGVAAAFMAKKIGEVAEQFADAAIELAKYETETSALEKTIIGMSVDGLEEMRKELNLTEAESLPNFFEAVRKGINELGMSKEQILGVSKALQETFGGDQTERLKKYLDLLEAIPTVNTDLKITTSMDDQTAALYGIMKEGKLGVTLDLQTAGLLGGKQEKQPDVDMANAALKSTAHLEGIKDFLLGTFFPAWGVYAKDIVGAATQGVTAIGEAVAVVGALRLLTNSNHNADVIQRAEIGKEIVAAMETSGGKGAATGGGGSQVPGGPTKGLSKLSKGLGLAAIAAFGTGLVLDHFEKQAKKAGDETGAAGYQMGKAATSVASFALLGAELGSMVPIIGTAVGAAAGALLGLYQESGNIKEAWGKMTPTVNENTKEMSDNKTAVGAVNDSMMKSAMEWGRFDKMVDTNMNSIKFKLGEFNKAVAEAALNLAQRIGTGQQFNNKAQAAFASSQAIYQEKMTTITALRVELDKNMIMSAEHRANEEKRLGDLKVQADQEYIDSTMKVADTLTKAPEIIAAGLKASFAERSLGIGATGETLGPKEKKALEGEQMAALMDQQAKLIEKSRMKIEATQALIKEMDDKANADRIAAKKVADDKVNQFDEAAQTAAIKTAKDKADESRKVMTDFWDQVVEAQSKKRDDHLKGVQYKKDTHNTRKDDEPFQDDMNEQDEIIKKGMALQDASNKDLAALNEAMNRKNVLLEEQKRLSSIPLNDGKVDQNVVGKMLVDRANDAVKLQSELKDATDKLVQAPEAGKQQDFAKSAVDQVRFKLSRNEAEQEALKRMQDTGRSNNLIEQTLLDTLRETDDLGKKQLSARQSQLTTFDMNIQKQERIVQDAEADVAIASKTGDAIAENAKLASERSKLSRMEYENYAKYVDVTKETAKLREDADIAIKQASTLSKDDPMRKLWEGIAESIEGTIGGFNKSGSDAKRQAGEAAQKFHAVGDFLHQGLAVLAESAAGKAIANLSDLSRALIDSADYAGDLGKISRDSFAAAKEAADRQLKLTEDNFNKQMENEKKSSPGRIRESVAGGATLEAATAEENKRLQVVAQEYNTQKMTNHFKTMVAAAESMKRAEEDRVDIQKGLIDDAMSFAQDFGGSFATIMKLQQLNVGVAQQQLDIAKEYRDKVLEATKAGAEWTKDGTAMMKANADVASKTFGLKRQELGVQKSLIDRMMGAVFGGLKGGGGRTNFGSNQAMLGVANTRLMSASGMYASGVPSEGAGTIAQRAFQRQMAGAGGVFKAAGGGAAGGGMGDILDTIMAAEKTKPAMSTLDKALGEATGITAKNTERSADALEELVKLNGGVVKPIHEKTARKELEIDKKELKNSNQELALSKKAAAGRKAGSGTAIGTGGVATVAVGLVATKKAELDEAVANLKYEKSYNAQNRESDDEVSRMWDQEVASKAKEADEANNVAKESEKYLEYCKGFVEEGKNRRTAAMKDYEKSIKDNQAESDPGKVKGLKRNEDLAIMEMTLARNEVEERKDMLKSAERQVETTKESADVSASNLAQIQKVRDDITNTISKNVRTDSDQQSIAEDIVKKKQDILATTTRQAFVVAMQAKTDEDEAKAANRPVTAFKGLSGTGGIRPMAGTKTGITELGGTKTGMTEMGGSKYKTAGQLAGQAAGMSVLPHRSGMQSSAGGSSTASAAKITGEIMVKFDNKMFIAQLTPIVGQILGNAESQKTIKKVAFA